ncbi:HAMP domain-containing protein, partial [Xanthomonas citri pv. citri]
MQRALALAATKKLQERDETLVQSLLAVRDKADKLDTMLDELIQQKEARAKTAADETSALFVSSRTTLIGIIAGGIALGIALGFIISRSVTQPLGRAVDVANQLAEGNLTVQIDATSRD